MNAEKFTQKSLDAVRTAKSMAEENRNNYITPEHLLYALVDQDGGLIPSLLGKMKVDCNAVLSELDTAIAALPKVGNVSEVYLSPECDRAISAAEKAAKIDGRRVHLRRASDDRHLRRRHAGDQAHFLRPRHHEGRLYRGAFQGQDRSRDRR